MICRNQLLKLSSGSVTQVQLKLSRFSTIAVHDIGKGKRLEVHSAVDAAPKVTSESFDNIKSELVKTFKALLDTKKGTSVSRQSTRVSELYQRQLALEEEQFDLAVQDYVDMQSGLMAMGKGTSMKSVQKTMVSWYEPLCTLIEKEVSSYAHDQKRIESDVCFISIFCL